MSAASDMLDEMLARHRARTRRRVVSAFGTGVAGGIPLAVAMDSHGLVVVYAAVVAVCAVAWLLMGRR